MQISAVWESFADIAIIKQKPKKVFSAYKLLKLNVLMNYDSLIRALFLLCSLDVTRPVTLFLD